MFSLVSGPLIVMFILATFDPAETNSLLILSFFCDVSQEPSVFVKLLCGSEGKKWPLLTVYVLQEWLLHIGLLVLSSLC